MTTNLYLWLIPILPFAGFLINGFLGKRLPNALVSTIALAFPLAAFGVVARAAMLAWPGNTSGPGAITLPYADHHRRRLPHSPLLRRLHGP
jgi:NADH:ubiquinone oxidoreductase subunit 5 (subunit L)/multisubunit Na+/H+ antiporter MnhA subunit